MPVAARAEALQHAAHHVLVPDEHERRGRARDAHHHGPLEDGGDLVLHASRRGSCRAGRRAGPARGAAVRKRASCSSTRRLWSRVGELLVAAQRRVLGEEARRCRRGSRRRRRCEVTMSWRTPCGDAGLEHVARAEHVDAVLELARAGGPRRDDGGEVHHAVDAVLAARARRAPDRARRASGRPRPAASPGARARPQRSGARRPAGPRPARGPPGCPGSRSRQ